jgi:DNA-binding MarR family transcriptional regulator
MPLPRRASPRPRRHPPFRGRLRRHGLRATQFSILAALALAPPLPMGALAELLGLERTTLTRSATLLARNGWVRGDRSADGRARPLRLTASGRRKLGSAYASWKAAQDAVATKFHDGPLAAARLPDIRIHGGRE